MKTAKTIQDMTPSERILRRLRYRSAAVWIILMWPLLVPVYLVAYFLMKLLIGSDANIGFSPSELWNR